jgi:hypothetical protein
MKKFLPFIALLCIYILQGCKKEIKSTDQNTDIVPSAASKGGKPSVSSIIQWQKSYGSSATDMGFAITKALDGSGYVLAGNSLGNNGDVSVNKGSSDAWIIKIDLNGSLIWQKTFGGSGSDWAYDVVATADGGYVFSGATSSVDGDLASLTNHGGTDTWVVKLSGTGDMIWQQEFGGSGTERGESIIPTADGGFVIGGYSNSNDGNLSMNHGDYDAWLIKLNTSGTVEWQKLYGGSAYEAVGSILEIAGGFTICASAASSNGDLSLTIPHGGHDVWIYTIDGQGNFISGKTYGGSGGEDGGQIYTSADGYMFSATTASNNADVSGNHGYVDTWLVKTGATGNIIWQKCFGGTDMDNARICNVDASGNIVLTGYTFSRSGDIPGSKGSEDMWVLKTDANGNKIYSGVLGGKNGDMSNATIPTVDGKYMSAGRSNSTSGDVSGNHGGEDVWVVKFGL